MEIQNKKAQLNYEFLEKIEAGIELTGAEVKAIRAGKVSLEQAYVKIIKGQAYLVNANFSTQVGENLRSRRLLLHKKQIINLELKIKAKKLTIIPIRLYNKDSLFKLEVALVRAKRKHEKRDILKKRDIDRGVERELKDLG